MEVRLCDGSIPRQRDIRIHDKVDEGLVIDTGTVEENSWEDVLKIR